MEFRRRLISGFRGTKERRLAQNYVSLSVLQVVNYAIPLITLPYLVRVLGVEKFGLVMFAGAFIKYFMLLIDFGFNLSATRSIAVNREDIKKTSEIFWSVIINKTIIMALGFCLLCILVYHFDRFASDRVLYFLAFGMVLGQVYLPVWFFLGMEKMKYLTILNIIAKGIFTVLIFVVVRDSSHYMYVLFVNSVGFMVAGAASFYLVLKHFKLKLIIPSAGVIYGHLKDSAHYFLSQISVMACTSSNAFILGLVSGNQAVAYYAAAEQLYKAMQGIFTPVVDSLYPYMSNERNIRLYRKMYFWVIGAAIGVSGMAVLLAEPATTLVFGQGFEPTASLLKLFALLMVVSVASMLLGYPCLAAMGHSRSANSSAVIGSVVHLILLMALIPVIGIYQVVIITILSELTVLLIRANAVRQHELWRYEPRLPEAI